MARTPGQPKKVARHTDEIIRNAEEGSELHQAAIEWAVDYCRFAGYPSSEARRIAENAKVEEKCGERVEKAYEKYV